MRLGLLLVLLISIVTDFAVYLLIICLGFTKLVNKEMHLLYMRFGCIFVTYQKGFTKLVNKEMHLLYMRFGFAVVQELVFARYYIYFYFLILNYQYFFYPSVWNSFLLLIN